MDNALATTEVLPAPDLEPLPAIAEWHQDAKPGDWTVYHTGDLALDRHPAINPHHYRTVCAEAEYAWEEMLGGELELVRQKVSTNTFRYIAIQRKEIVPKKTLRQWFKDREGR